MCRGFRNRLLAARRATEGEVGAVHSAEGVMLDGNDEVESFLVAAVLPHLLLVACASKATNARTDTVGATCRARGANATLMIHPAAGGYRSIVPHAPRAAPSAW